MRFLHALTICCAAALLLAIPAGASTSLTVKDRRHILRTVTFPAPNDPTVRIRDPACVMGYLSQVDQRYAAMYLSNTKSCVRRFGGASGEGLLVKRQSRRSVRWRQVGHVSDNCIHGTGGASDRVLRDLHCTIYPKP